MTTKTKSPTTAVDAATQAKETMDTMIKAIQEAVQKNYEQTLVATKEQFEKASQQLFRGYDDLAAFSKENIDAAVQASTILAKGMEDLSKAMMAYAQSSVEQSVETGKVLLGVKTLRELVDLQSSYAKSSFDRLVSEGTKLSELSVKITNDAFAPLNARINAVVEKFAKPVAA